MLIRRYSISLLVVISVLMNKSLADDHSSEMVSIKAEINNYRSRIEETREKLKHENEKASSDSVAYLAYLSEHEIHLNQLETERDSLSALSLRLQNRRDSLGTAESAVNLKKESVIKHNKNVMADLQVHCRQLIDALAGFEMYNIGRQISALKFLEGEIVSNTINVAEGIERYWQIVSQIEQASHKIEVWNGASPVAAIKGDVQFMRMGFIWLVCIGNENNSVFTYSNKNKKWDAAKNDEQIAGIRQAVKLSTGMASPQLVALPVVVELKSVLEDVGK